MSVDERRARALFIAALELPEGRRTSFLDETCGGDEALRARVDVLLVSHDEAGSFLDQPVFQVEAAGIGESFAPSEEGESPAGFSAEATPPPSASGAAGPAIGPYLILKKIGEGGMGEVWLARQTSPIRRIVALKVIKAGMDTKQVVARFEAERQALALMDHPAIAKVFEAGETPRGLPYFAMEFVQGEPITTHCDRHRLRMRERLELFTQVCEGIQHAHQKGIIHRDLKPSNVLVAVQGGKPVPKVIDFGVAKAIAQRLTERTMLTELGVLIGTPEYMSPEQADLTGLDIDTRTDVYALGIILYEILVGTLPLERGELREAGFDEIRRRIREVDPPRPSTRISKMGEASLESARNRNTDPARLTSQLKGDLDWITMKALEKDRARRYGSPSEMAADIGRHLRHEPVLAGAPGTGYRTKKFVLRHRFGVAIAAVTVAALACLAVTMTVQARRIARERDRANRQVEVSRRVSDFMVGLFKVSDPSESRGNSITARAVLDRGEQRIEKELNQDPEVQAQLMATMGAVYRNLGLYRKAEPLLRKVLEIRRRVLGPEHPDTLDAMLGLAWVDDPLSRYAEAEKLLREGLEAQRRILGVNHPDTLRTEEYLGGIYQHEGRIREALEIHRRVLDARRHVLGENDLMTLWSMANVAVNLEVLGKAPEAEKMLREIAERRRRVLGADHPDTLSALKDVAGVCVRMGRYEEAEKLFREAYEGQRRVLGEDHPDTLDYFANLAGLYQATGRKEEAVKLYREGLETCRRLLGATDSNTLAYMSRLADLYSDLDRFAEAKKLYLEAIDVEKRSVGPEHPDTLTDMHNLAYLYFRMGNYAKAEEVFLGILAIERRVFGDEYPNTLATMGNLAPVYVKQGRYEEADRLFRETIEKKRRVLGEGNLSTLISIYRMGCACALRGHRQEALDWIRQAVEGGYRDAERLAKDHDCQSLHHNPEFERLVAVARMNAEKLAKGVSP